MARARSPKTTNRSRAKKAAAPRTARKSTVAKQASPEEAKSNDGATPGVIATLKSDNHKIEQAIGDYIGAGGDEAKRREAATKLRDAVEVHQRMLETAFYPACRDAMTEHAALDRAEVMSGLIDGLLKTVGRDNDDAGHAKVQVLSELIRDRIRADEAPTNGLFARAAASGVDTPDLARRLNDARNHQETSMARYDHDRDQYNRGNRDQDNQGRFLRDQDDHRPGGTLDRYSDGRDYYGHDRGGYNQAGDYRSAGGRGYDEARSFGRSQYNERDDRGRYTREDDRRFGTSGQGGRYDRYDSDRAYGARGSSPYDRNEYGGFQSGYDQGQPYARGYSGDYNRDYQTGRSLSRDQDQDRGNERGQQYIARNAEYGPQGAHPDYERNSVDQQRGYRMSGADDHDYTRRAAGSRSHGQGGWESWR
ncbi:MAG TPA: hypothetical protein VG407_13735 [Caulobacteraceae bacterium]|jgi:hypothetical protein|nr:hypothetical protein [Caulobacteraceae bacterium]